MPTTNTTNTPNTPSPPVPPMAVSLAGLRLRSPVIVAAGTAGTLDEIGDHLDLSRIGALTTKSITPLPRDGNPPWRVAPVRAGMINAVGLANPGIDPFLRDWAPRIPTLPCPVIGSIAGFSIDDYRAVAAAFNSLHAMPAVELNVSCPNVRHGVEFGSHPTPLAELVAAVRAELTRARLFVKLPPLAIAAPHSIADLAAAAIAAGADGLCIANTTPAMAIDVHSLRPALGNVTGGLSGPAVHPIVTRLIYDAHAKVARAASVPIIGIGGVMDWRDAAEFILAGASAVQVGTATFVDPRAPLKIHRGLERWARRLGRDILALTGAAHPPLKTKTGSDPG